MLGWTRLGSNWHLARTWEAIIRSCPGPVFCRPARRRCCCRIAVERSLRQGTGCPIQPACENEQAASTVDRVRGTSTPSVPRVVAHGSGEISATAPPRGATNGATVCPKCIAEGNYSRKAFGVKPEGTELPDFFGPVVTGSEGPHTRCGAIAASSSIILSNELSASPNSTAAAPLKSTAIAKFTSRASFIANITGRRVWTPAACQAMSTTATPAPPATAGHCLAMATRKCHSTGAQRTPGLEAARPIECFKTRQSRAGAGRIGRGGPETPRAAPASTAQTERAAANVRPCGAARRRRRSRARRRRRRLPGS